MALAFADAAQLRTAFEALSVGGKVVQAPFDAPWGDVFGVRPLEGLRRLGGRQAEHVHPQQRGHEGEPNVLPLDRERIWRQLDGQHARVGHGLEPFLVRTRVQLGCGRSDSSARTSSASADAGTPAASSRADRGRGSCIFTGLRLRSATVATLAARSGPVQDETAHAQPSRSRQRRKTQASAPSTTTTLAMVAASRV